jgi:glutathione S-transferase
MWKLFHYPWAPYARKALLAGYDLELAFDEVVTPAFDKECMAELRRRTTPLATTPLLLLEDGSFISESSLIIEYFDLESPERGRLVPLDPHAALRVRSFDRLAEGLLGPTLYLTWALRKPPAETNHKKIAEVRGKMNTVFGVFDQHLDGKSFLFDDRFTMADIAPACAISVLVADRSIKLEDLDEHRNVRRWYERVQARPSWKRMEECAARIPRPVELA